MGCVFLFFPGPACLTHMVARHHGAHPLAHHPMLIVAVRRSARRLPTHQPSGTHPPTHNPPNFSIHHMLKSQECIWPGSQQGRHLALNNANVLGLKKAHVLVVTKADVSGLKKARVFKLSLNRADVLALRSQALNIIKAHVLDQIPVHELGRHGSV